jgi:hypothetical protein
MGMVAPRNAALALSDGNFYPYSQVICPVAWPIAWEGFMRSVLLWAVGIPLPIILILWLVTGHA